MYQSLQFSTHLSTLSNADVLSALIDLDFAYPTFAHKVTNKKNEIRINNLCFFVSGTNRISDIKKVLSDLFKVTKCAWTSSSGCEPIL